MREADAIGGRVGDFVAEVKVNAMGCISGQRTQVGVKRRRWRVTSVADADAVGMIVAQTPADVRPTLPIAAVIEIEEAAIGCRSGMTAGRPFLVNLPMTVAAILPVRRIGIRLYP